MLVASHEHIHLGAKIPVGLVAAVEVAAVCEHTTVAVMAASHGLDEAEKC